MSRIVLLLFGCIVLMAIDVAQCQPLGDKTQVTPSPEQLADLMAALERLAASDGGASKRYLLLPFLNTLALKLAPVKVPYVMVTKPPFPKITPAPFFNNPLFGGK